MTGDAQPGAIVEARSYEDASGRRRLSLATRSIGGEVLEAMDRRGDHLVEKGLAHRQGQRVIFARDLLNTLRRRELNEVSARLAAKTGLVHRPSAEGEHVAGVYRQRVSLSSGRFAMIDDGLGFQLVPFLSGGRLSCALCKGTARLAKRGKHLRCR
jgi:hypothetical protein